MLTDVTGVSSPPATNRPEVDTWGTASYFRRLARVDLDVAAYWVGQVHRPAHRFQHPHLNIEGCPGCAFETAVR